MIILPGMRAGQAEQSVRPERGSAQNRRHAFNDTNGVQPRYEPTNTNAGGSAGWCNCTRLTPRLILAVAGLVVASIPVTLLGYAADARLGTAAHIRHRGGAVPAHMGRRSSLGGQHDAGDQHILHPWVLRAVAAVIVGWLLWRRQRRLALWVAVTMIVAGILGDGLKTLVARARPHLPHPVATAPGASFPSGHALNSFVFFGIVVLLLLPVAHGVWRWVVWTAGIIAVLLVGFSRVGLGVHFVSDVVAGWLLGAGLLALTAAAFESWRRAQGRIPVHVVEEGVEPDEVSAVEYRQEPRRAVRPGS